MRRTWMVMAAMALVAGPLLAQQTQQERERQREERRELERQMRELQGEIRELQRRLNELTREEIRAGVTPRGAAGVTPMTLVFGPNRARLGVNVDTRRDPARDSIGAEIASVTPGGPADQAGLRAGDIVTTFNGELLAGRYPAASEHESEPGLKLIHFARELEDGDTVQVEYRRGRDTRRATIVARELEREDWFRVTARPPTVEVDPAPFQRIARTMAMTFGDRWLDMELVSLNPELGEYFGTNEGLLVIRAPRDTSLNLRSGDVILRIDGRRPTSHSQLIRILRSYAAGESVEIEIMRQKRRQTVTATIPDREDGHEHEWNWEHR